MVRAHKVPVVSDLAELEARMQQIVSSFSLAPKTLGKYDEHWSAFTAWCTEAGVASLPASEETVAAYFASRAAEGKAGSLDLMAAAINRQHSRAGYPKPTGGFAALTRRGISRQAASEVRRARPLTAPLTERAAAAAPQTSLTCLQQRAALLVAHACDAPFSHLCAISPADIVDDGRDTVQLVLPELRRWGPRPAFSARRVSLPATGGELCPVAALRRLVAARQPGDRFLPEPGAATARLKQVAGYAGYRLRDGLLPWGDCDEDDLWRLVTFMSRDDVTFLRDRAYLLLTHGGAFRPSEPLTLRPCDVTDVPEGIIIRLPFSKTDQFGRGEYVAVPSAPNPAHCPVAALHTLIRLVRPDPDEPIFRARFGSRAGQAPGSSVGRAIVQTLTARAELDGHFSGHSPRRGFCVSADAAGETLLRIAVTTRHRRLETTRDYIDQKAPHARTAPRALGL